VKVLHVPHNVASQMSVTVRGLRNIGVDARGLVRNNHLIKDDRELETFTIDRKNKNTIKRWKQEKAWRSAFLKAVRWADVVHWHYTTRALRWNLDLMYVSLLNKGRIIEFWGTDIRDPEIASIDNPYMERFYKDDPEFEERRRVKSIKNQTRFAKYGFKCLIPGEELGAYVNRDIFPTFYRTRQRLILEDYPVAYPDRDNPYPLVVHMVSNKVRKGTESVLRSVNQLKNTYAFDFKLIHNVSKSEAAAVLRQSDIVLDQFVVGDYGLAAVESMASGKPTVCYIKPSILKEYPEDFPVVVASQDNLAEVVEALLKDGWRRHEIGRRSRAYVEQYHDGRKVVRDLVCIYEELLGKKNASRLPRK